MDNLLRNREFRRYLLGSLAVGAATVGLCFWQSVTAGIFSLVGILCILGLYVRFSMARYQRLAGLSDQLARIAAGNYQLDIGEYAEGELSILASEIVKITSTLTHQAELLERDKTYLADSLADISHQLKTPLTTASMMVELLASPDLEEMKRQEFLEGIQLSLTKLQWLIQSLLKLSRLDAGSVVFQREQTSVAEVLRDAAKPLQILSELKDQRLCIKADTGLELVTDRLWLQEAVQNLVKNCVENTPEGGEVVLSCRENTLYSELVVEDNGPGVATEDLPHIFERFYRGKQASPEGVGIGLSLSKSIVQKLDGTIAVENKPEGGARFVIRFYR